jgi:hypothetical protein
MERKLQVRLSTCLQEGEQICTGFEELSGTVLSQPKSRFSLKLSSVAHSLNCFLEPSRSREFRVAIDAGIAQSNHRRRNLVSPANSKVQYQKVYFSDSIQPSELGHKRRFCHVASHVPLFLAPSIAVSAIIRYSTLQSPVRRSHSYCASP